MRPGRLLALRVVQHFLVYMLCLVPIVLLLDALDGEGKLPGKVRALVPILAPLCAAGAAAVVIAATRVRGVWDLWSLLGYSRSSVLMPMVLLSLLAASLDFVTTASSSSQGSSAARAGLWAGPAPVDPGAVLWPSTVGWSTPDLSLWMAAPATLSTTELLGRIAREAPRGARSGVDRGELVRRLAWSLAWPVGVLFGAWRALACTPVRRRRRGSPVLQAAVETLAGVLLWLLSALVAAAYLSSTM